MARIIPVGFGEASLVFGSSSGTPPFVTTIGLSLIGIAPENYVGVCNNVMIEYQDLFQANTTEDVSMLRVDLAVGLPGDTSGTVTSTLPSWEGSSSGEYEPLSMAVIANKLSADLGRKGKGRSFLVGLLSDGAVGSNGRIALGTRTTYNEKWNDYLIALATGDPGIATAPVILHSDGSEPSVIIGGSISEQVGWVRKRLR